MVRREHTRRDHPGVQRPRHGVQPRTDPDVRRRHRRTLRRGRRGMGPAPRAQRRWSCRTGLAHRALGDPTGLRPDDRQPHGRRPRTHRAVVADVRPARSVALPRRSHRRQRRALPGAVGSAVPRPRPGDPQGGGVVRRRSERADLGHRWDEPSTAGPPRRAHQQGVRQRISRRSDREARPTFFEAARRLHPRSRVRGHRTRDVADRPGCDVRRGVGRWTAADRAAPLLSRPCEQHRGGPPDPGGRDEPGETR